jgi:hypothetical protein
MLPRAEFEKEESMKAGTAVRVLMCLRVVWALLVLAMLLNGCGKGDGGAAGTSSAVAALTPVPSAVVTGADLENIRAGFQACFATASRGTFAGADLSAACASMPIDAGYQHQGRNRAQDFDGVLADATMDGATFFEPVILRQASSTRVLARFPLLKANGLAWNWVTVAEKAGEAWALVGNGRDFNTFVNAFANRRISLRAGQIARLETGVVLRLRNNPARFPQDADIESVTVFGPGLPGFVDASHPGTGLALVNLPGCRFWAISANACGDLWRVRVDDAGTGSPIPVESLGPRLQALTANPYLTDAEVAGIPPHAAYKWVIALAPGSPTALARRATTLTYWDRLRSRPLTSEEIGKIGFLDITQETLDLLQNFNGGDKATLAWTSPDNAAPASMAAVFHGRFIDFQRVRRSDTSATISCSANPNCNPDGTYRIGMSFTQNGNATFAMFQLISWNRNGTQVFSQYTR